VLADQRPPGEVPFVVADAVDGPVVMGRVLSAVPDELPPCDHGWEWEDGPTIDGVFVGVEVVSVVYRATGVPIPGVNPETALVHCDYALDDGGLVLARHGWTRQPGQMDSFSTDAWTDVQLSSDPQRRRAAVSVELPGSVAWMLVEHDGYHLALDVEDVEVARVSWVGAITSFDGFPWTSSALLLDESGRTIATVPVATDGR
jgi:hypothetical protein